MKREKPGYIELMNRGELKRRTEALDALLEDCTLCPHNCGVNRKEGIKGLCRSGYLPIVSSWCDHHGEEPVISGTRGSGTIFFGYCNLRCVFCQNHQISQPMVPLDNREVSFERLADMMLELQDAGCHNINFVSPTHFSAQIVRSVEIAAGKGLRIPLVYNTNAYDSIETLRLLDGIIDVYLPDIKYGNDHDALEYSRIRDYVKHSREAIGEMCRQVGGLTVDEMGIAIKGLIIRHLVLPNDMAGSEESLSFISEKIGKDTCLSVMSQYYPSHKAMEHPLLSRHISAREYEKVLDLLDEFGLKNGWVQEHASKDYYRPDFEKEHPFE